MIIREQEAHAEMPIDERSICAASGSRSLQLRTTAAACVHVRAYVHLAMVSYTCSGFMTNTSISAHANVPSGMPDMNPGPMSNIGLVSPCLLSY